MTAVAAFLAGVLLIAGGAAYLLYKRRAAKIMTVINPTPATPAVSK